MRGTTRLKPYQAKTDDNQYYVVRLNDDTICGVIKGSNAADRLTRYMPFKENCSLSCATPMEVELLGLEKIIEMRNIREGRE